MRAMSHSNALDSKPMKPIFSMVSRVRPDGAVLLAAASLFTAFKTVDLRRASL